MDQLLLLARDLTRVEQRFRYYKADRRKSGFSPQLDADLKRLGTVYRKALNRAEREMTELQVGNTTGTVKREILDTLKDNPNCKGMVLKRSMFNIEYHPIVIVVYFKDGHDAKAYLDEYAYGFSCIMQNSLTAREDPIALIILGKRINWMHHEHAHVFNIYRGMVFGEIPEVIDELSAYIVSCPLVRLRMLDQTRAVELAAKYGLHEMRREFELDIGTSVCIETNEEVPYPARINARTMLGSILDLDALEIEKVFAIPGLTTKERNKILCGQHPFEHLDGEREVLFLTSSVVTLTRGENKYTHPQLVECIRA